MPMSFGLPEGDGAVTKLADLAAAERFVIRAFRHWVAGMGRPDLAVHCAVVWNDFARDLGTADGKAALTAFAAMIHGIARAARRPIQCHRPCCSCLTADEFWVIRLAQAGQDADHVLAAALCCWLVAGPDQPEVIRNAIAFGGLLRQHGHHLPSRHADSATPRHRTTGAIDVVPQPASPDRAGQPPNINTHDSELCG